jgi:peptidoglycan hydrolase-like protein with peptidoglycan-binding domain
MNKLLSFSPEPFDSELEFEAFMNGFGTQGESFEQEEEYESGRRRPRSFGRGSFRSSASPRPARWAKTGAKTPVKSPSGKLRPFPIKWPEFPAGVPAWPPVPQPDSDARRWSGGDQGPGDQPPGTADQSRASQSSDIGSDFVRWAQTCLNGYLGLTLPVDGVLDLNTRSAIRTFQERQGLPITGRIGPKTEAALKEACRPPEPGGPAPSDELSSEFELRAFRGNAQPLHSARFVQLVRAGQTTTAIAEAVKAGESDINQLTNRVFYARHPELGSRRVQTGERALAQEWLQIRDSIVRPTLATVGARTTLPASSSGSGAQPTPIIHPANQPLFLGIDTYGLDGNRIRDWARAKAQVPISFAFFRSNFGTFPDTAYKKEWPRIKSAGLIGGAYLFLRFPNPEVDKKYGPSPAPAKQAQALIDTVGRIHPSDFPPTIDVEFPNGGREITGMTAQECLDHVRIAWKVLKDYYRAAPIIYTSERVWREELKNLRALDLIESPLWLKDYPFREGPARYSKEVVRFKPRVPAHWGDITNWWIHQYQGDAVKLPGFATGNVDMNRFNTLVKGASGDQVKWVQRRLGITVNGLFDAAMETALARFQHSRNLPATPVVDPQTFAYLCWSNP